MDTFRTWCARARARNVANYEVQIWYVVFGSILLALYAYNVLGMMDSLKTIEEFWEQRMPDDRAAENAKYLLSTARWMMWGSTVFGAVIFVTQMWADMEWLQFARFR